MRYPRFFTHVDRFEGNTLLIEIRSKGEDYIHCRDGSTIANPRYCGKTWEVFADSTVEEGIWKEITAAEARERMESEGKDGN
jgi:hypothetical protein